jgi:pyruvate,water dikinase
VAELVALGVRIEQLYGQPMDVEWAARGGRLFVVQARPITALPEPKPVAAPGTQPAAPAAAEWPVPDPHAKYARSSAIELLPDPLSPLFETLALPEWNAAMSELFREVGLPGEMTVLCTVNGYAYYRVTFGARETLSTLGALPRIPRFMGIGRERWQRETRPAYVAATRTWEGHDLSRASATQLVDGAHDLVVAASRHYLTIQGGILPQAYMSEALFTLAYDKLIKRASDPPALTLLLGFESTPIRAEKSLYDLAVWARSQEELAAALEKTPSAQIAAALPASAPGLPEVRDDLWRASQPTSRASATPSTI